MTRIRWRGSGCDPARDAPGKHEPANSNGRWDEFKPFPRPRWARIGMTGAAHRLRGQARDARARSLPPPLPDRLTSCVEVSVTDSELNRSGATGSMSPAQEVARSNSAMRRFSSAASARSRRSVRITLAFLLRPADVGHTLSAPSCSARYDWVRSSHGAVGDDRGECLRTESGGHGGVCAEPEFSLRGRAGDWPTLQAGELNT